MLEVKAISKWLGGRAVLRDVNLKVAPGEVVGLVGMNGSGKTTLLDVLSGHTRANGGEVWVDGHRAVPRPTFAERAPIFRTYQVPRLFYGLSAADNLKLGRWSLGIVGAAAEDVLPGPTLERPAETLSIGQRRRVVLDWLRVRVEHAKYFLLDEPAAGGDDALVMLLLDFLAEARRRGRGVLLVEHRDGVLRAACDRILYLRDGTCSPEPPVNGAVSAPPGVGRVVLAEAGNGERLSARDLVVARGSAVVLNEVNFEAGNGDVIAVTGPNGCGKSTLLRAIYGDPACPVTSGALTSDGADLNKLSLRERAGRGVHLLPQDGAFFLSMTVEDALRTSVESIDPQVWSIEAVGRIQRELPLLERVWDRRCGLLSGGERRLVSFARMLLLRPRVALLDEPLAGVDSEGQARVVGLVRSLAENGAAVLVAEQASSVGQLLSDRVIEIGSPGRARAGVPRSDAEDRHARPNA